MVQYRLPKIEDLFTQLSGGTSFTKLDLWYSYCQLELYEESRYPVEINTHRGFRCKTRITFGIFSAPAIFQRRVDKILQRMNGASKSIRKDLKCVISKDICRICMKGHEQSTSIGYKIIS